MSFLMLAWLAAAPLPTAEIAVSTREPLAFVQLTPSGGRALVGRTEILSQLAGVIERNSGVVLRELDPEVAEECGARLDCIAMRARHGEGAPPDLLLVLIVEADPPRGDHVASFLVDTSSVASIFERERDPRVRLGRLMSEAVINQVRSREVRTPEALREALNNLVLVELEETLARRGLWKPFGTVELVGVPSGAEIWVGDAGPLPAPRAKALKIVDVPREADQLRVDHPDYFPFQMALSLSDQSQTRIELELVPRPKRYFYYSGWGLAGVGAVLVGAAGVRRLTASDVRCVSVVTDCDIALEPAWLPRIGLALASTGATWVLGGLLSDNGEVPLWVLIGGLVIGAGVAASVTLASP